MKLLKSKIDASWSEASQKGAPRNLPQVSETCTTDKRESHLAQKSYHENQMRFRTKKQKLMKPKSEMLNN